MTSVTGKHVSKGPLTDKTNILNMKSNGIKDYVDVSTSIISSETHVKKGKIIQKKSTLLDEAVYQVEKELKTYGNENIGSRSKVVGQNKVKQKKKIPSENTNVINSISGKASTLDKKELFVKVTRIPNNENNKLSVGKKSSKIKNNILQDVTVFQIDKSIVKSSKSNFAHVSQEKKDKASDEIKDKQVYHQLLSDMESHNKKNLVCTKELFVKIPKIFKNGSRVNTEKTSSKNRTRRKSIILDETAYQINENITEPFRNNSESCNCNNKNEDKHFNINKETDKNRNKTDVIQSANSIVGIKTKKNICTKELIVKITEISDKNSGINKPVEENHSLKNSIINEKSLNNLVTNTKTTICTKELLVKVTNISNQNTRTNKATEEKPQKNQENLRVSEKLSSMNNVVGKKTEKTICTKELLSNITQISNKNNEINKLSEEKQNNNLESPNVKEKSLNIINTVVTNTKCINELTVNITKIQENTKVHNEIEEKQKNSPKKCHINGKAKKTVSFKLYQPKLKESHNLRKQHHKNYLEDSLINSTNNGNPYKPENEEPVQINKEKKDGVPIYRKILLESENNKQGDDLYEFVDTSPKSTKTIKARRPHRSSIIFDKNTHEILQKIEEKEAKAKKKVIRRKKKILKPIPGKLYDKIVDKIVSDVRGKIVKKHEANLMTKEKNNDKKTVNNEKLLAQNTLNNELQGPKYLPSNPSHNKVIQVNNFNEEINIILHDSADTLNNKIQGPKNVPLNAGDNIVIQVNNFDDEMSVIVHHSAEEPPNNEKTVPQRHTAAKNIRNITTGKDGNADVIQLDTSVINGVINKEDLTTEKTVVTEPHLDTFDKLKESGNVIQPIFSPILFDSISLCPDPDNSVSPILFDSISLCHGSDNSVSQKDIDSCFGFEDDDDVPPPPVVSMPNKAMTKGAANILENVVVRCGTQDVESPIDFNVRRPNANSTMIHIGVQRRTSSPWRPNWVNTRPNPHFVSVKSNALPRIDQDLVIDHTLVEEFESHCSNTPKKKGSETPMKKSPVQQSILDFVGSNVEKENDTLHSSSLFDYAGFDSPVKKTRKGKENQRVKEVKRNLLGDEGNIVSSTPIQRKVLGDISNSSGEQVTIYNSTENDTYFGFIENSSNSTKKTPEKRKNENDSVAKPSRFNLRALRSYSAKDRKNKKVTVVEEPEAVHALDESISLMEASNEENTEEEVRLFEEPEEMLDNMSLVHISEKKHRRKRLDSCYSDTNEGDKKRKKHKKTKREIEQEKWIEQFNQLCDEVEEHQLEIE